MSHRLLLSIALLAAVALVTAGCGDKSSSTDGSGGTTTTTTVRTMDEYRAEADKQITKDNAEAELDRLEKEINADE